MQCAISNVQRIIIQGLEKELAAKRRTLSKLRDKSMALSSPKFGDKIQSSAMDNSHIIDKIIDMETAIREKELELVGKISEISKSIADFQKGNGHEIVVQNAQIQRCFIGS